MSYSDELRSTPIAAIVLGLGCTAPFLIVAFDQWTPFPFISTELGLKVLTVLAAIVLSFAGGVRWGVALKYEPGNRQSTELVASMLAALAGWSAVFLSQPIGLILLIAGFLLQALWDVLSVEQGRLPQWFGALRMMLTVGVVLSLFSMLGKLIIS